MKKLFFLLLLGATAVQAQKKEFDEKELLAGRLPRIFTIHYRMLLNGWMMTE